MCVSGSVDLMPFWNQVRLIAESDICVFSWNDFPNQEMLYEKILADIKFFNSDFAYKRYQLQ